MPRDSLHHVTRTRLVCLLTTAFVRIMPISRKPAPSLESVDGPHTDGTSPNVMPNEEIRRFTLTNDPAEPSSSYGELAYDQIDEAVTLMQQRFHGDASSPSRPPLPAPPHESLPSSSDVDLHVPMPETPYRDNYASSNNMPYDQDAYYHQGVSPQQELDGDGFVYPQPVPHPPRLPTIDSGLPMQWDLGDGHDASDPFLDNSSHQTYSDPNNPFHDRAAPVPSLPPDRMEPMDSFQYDPERYGSYAQSSYIPSSRSRSPTPGHETEYYVEDEKDNSGYLDQDSGHDGSGDTHDPEKMLTPDDPPMDTKHFGPAPTGRVLRRHKTKKRVPLTEGNLVTHIDVPTQLVLPRKGEPEMMQTRCVYVGAYVL